MTSANTIQLAGSAALMVGVNELLDFPGCKIGHRRLDLIGDMNYEIHGGPAPNLSCEDFLRSTFDGTRLQGDIFLKGGYDAGPNIPLKTSTIINQTNGTKLGKVANAAVASANSAFQNEEYRWFGPNSNTYNHYILMYMTAEISSIQGVRLDPLDFFVPNVYIPNSWSWKTTLQKLPEKLQPRAKQYVESCIKLNALPWDDFASSNLCESIVELVGKILKPFEDALNLMVEGVVGSAVGITKVAGELLKGDAKGVIRALGELEDFTVRTVKKAWNATETFVREKVVKPVRRLIDKIVDFFGF